MATNAERQATGWVGWLAFAATMMVIIGALNAIEGLIAILNDDWIVFGNQANLYFDVSQWGWVHLILGVLVVAAGLAIYSGNVLARTVGVVLAGVSIIANFLWLPAYPVWSIIIIAVNVLVIWALTTHGREMRA
jgi:hypothetical protein